MILCKWFSPGLFLATIAIRAEFLPYLQGQASIMSQREATVSRETLETQISVFVNLAGRGNASFETGLPFLEHMLDQVARHGMLDIEMLASPSVRHWRKH